MATGWDDSHFLSLDDELDDVFEPQSSASLEIKSYKECRIMSEPDATTNYLDGHVAGTGTPTISISHSGTVCQGLVTLRSLSSAWDSGYVPSPSAFYSSDEDECTDIPERPRPGVTPPITIPHSCLRPAMRHQMSRCSRQEAFTETVQNPVVIRRGRSKSCPATVRASLPQRLQVSCRRTFTPVPPHGSTWLIPAGGSNGQCHLMPPLKTEGTIVQDAEDLIKEGGTLGHQCRVLVLAIPELVPESKRNTPDSNIHQSPTPARSSRPRAFSCEVTLAEEVGRKLRWIADSFSTTSLSQLSDTPSSTSSDM